MIKYDVLWSRIIFFEFVVDVDLKCYCDLAMKALDEDDTEAATVLSDSIGGSEKVEEVDVEVQEIEQEEDLEGPAQVQENYHMSSPGSMQSKEESSLKADAETQRSETPRSPQTPEQLTAEQEDIERALVKALSLIVTLQNLGLDISQDIPTAELPKLFTLPEDAIPYMELADKFGKKTLSFAELGWILSENIDYDDDEEV